VNGEPPSADLGYFIDVSPRWLNTMRIPLIAGRDFRAGDTEPGAAIVNEAFAEEFFHGENPIGRYFEKAESRSRFQVVGLVRNARYRDLRGPILPVAYVPFDWVDRQGAPRPKRFATLIVRTVSANPMALASILRKEVARARPELRVSNVQTQEELNRSLTVRERLLAMLGMFFAAVALLLAGIGLYGVLDYSVIDRRREIGIRLAVGAQPREIARRVTAEVFRMIVAGAVGGLVLGLASVRYIESLLYQVKATDAMKLAFSALAILVAASLAALPAVVRAVRTDPVSTLRSE
jgi:hypothetical protein